MADTGDDATKQVGQVSAEPLPNQLSQKTTYSITAQSNNDNEGTQTSDLSMTVNQPAICRLQSAKSTETVVSCLIQDAHNMYNNALYVLIQNSATNEPLEDPTAVSNFFCYPRPTEPPPTSANGLKFTCMKEAPLCCCWVFLPEPSTRDPHADPRVIAAKVFKNECGLEQFQRYDTFTMGAGTNPLQLDAAGEPENVAVVHSEVFDFTMPVKPEPKPIQFEMAVNMDYEKECNSDPGAAQRCKDNMQKELSAMLGAPSEMISVRDVRPR
jgi:hypothetical protein